MRQVNQGDMIGATAWRISMAKRELVKISIRVDELTLKRLRRLMGIPDNSKVIRGAMNFTVNVAHNLFSGNLSNMFKRRKENEELQLYDQEV